ncbi:hypothetical protein NQ315_005962 [Exocentrus adspersus]|uniref:Uncharacterized protein n=1 Tax=Exocentrus adspersus TaxID=1586481 RepID=A0AAV8VB33_9CUCU|nr:hypothetical protein NQ315_005962 [Exocentrus adspersus]
MIFCSWSLSLHGGSTQAIRHGNEINNCRHLYENLLESTEMYKQDPTRNLNDCSSSGTAFHLKKDDLVSKTCLIAEKLRRLVVA